MTQMAGESDLYYTTLSLTLLSVLCENLQPVDSQWLIIFKALVQILALWIFTFKGFKKACSVDVYCTYKQFANEDDALFSIIKM